MLEVVEGKLPVIKELVEKKSINLEKRNVRFNDKVIVHAYECEESLDQGIIKSFLILFHIGSIYIEYLVNKGFLNLEQYHKKLNRITQPCHMAHLERFTYQ
jgi:hypothetical protein